MKFVFYHAAINKARTMMVDGVEEARVNISHWPGNQTPEHLKADTTTEMALNLAVDPYADRLFENIEFVSNNHFDTDGLLSCWAVLHPREALHHREFLTQAAQAGDFGWFTSPEAVKFDLVISAFENPLRSPLRSQFSVMNERQQLQLIYDTLLEELPELLSNFEERYRDLYEEEFAQQVEAMLKLTNGTAKINEYAEAGLSVIESREKLPLTARFNAAQHDRLLTFVEQEGGRTVDFCYDIVTWFETRTISKRPRIELSPLADRLNLLEASLEAEWHPDSLDALYPHLTLTNPEGHPVPTQLSKEFVVRQFVEFFEDAARTMA